MKSILVVSLVSCFALSGCGGGSGGGASTPVKTNSAPVVATANSDQTGALGDEYTYDASQSGATFSDSDGDTLSYSVSITPSGSGLTSSGAVISGQLSSLGTYSIVITATDPSGATATDTFDLVVYDGTSRVSGLVQYERIPVTIDGFQPSRSVMLPVRGADVSLLKSSGELVERVATTNEGRYSFELEPNERYVVRVNARLYFEEGDEPNVEVLDNTSSNALYAIQSSSFTATAGNTTLDLSANSGWVGGDASGGFDEERAAAPFALLDNAYFASQRILDVDPDADLSPLDIYWSELNNPTSGDANVGDLGSSYYTGGGIYILGKEDVDIDEYDEAVIYHEWMHYLQDAYGRSDSIGGSHGFNDKLDLRVAFGEGEATAYGAMLSGDIYYLDVSGEKQSFLGGFSVESSTDDISGWYSESTVVELLWDIYDSPMADDDNVSASLTQMMEVFTAARDTEAFNSLFVFSENVQETLPGSAVDIEALFAAEGINAESMNAWGIGSTNNGGSSYALPVYHELAVGKDAYFCNSDQFGTYNKLTNSAFMMLDINISGRYTISITRDSTVSSDNPSDPDFYIANKGVYIASGTSGAEDVESSAWALDPGRYAVWAHDWNFSDDVSPRDSTTCFTMSISLD